MAARGHVNGRGPKRLKALAEAEQGWLVNSKAEAAGFGAEPQYKLWEGRSEAEVSQTPYPEHRCSLKQNSPMWNRAI